VVVIDGRPFGGGRDQHFNAYGAGLADAGLETVRVREPDVGGDRLAWGEDEVLGAATHIGTCGFADLPV